MQASVFARSWLAEANLQTSLIVLAHPFWFLLQHLVNRELPEHWAFAERTSRLPFQCARR
jgi:hypothetical protein